ncbi:MAG TPA: hypothetical protein DIW31_11660 [Bacteroidales bacterium]|nr:hypothetical protein [Bacteroidales bacterium]
MKTHEIRRVYIWITLFSIAMAFLETAVVVYMRKLYYPEGFNFPLKIMDKDIMVVEVFREFATLVMLLGAGFIAGRNRTEKFGLFLYSFAVWDIFYYVFLKVTLDWPSSLMTWDILFLIPTTWVGPVIAPVIVSLVMIAFAFLISKSTSKNIQTKINLAEWLLLIGGSIVLIIGFVYDYIRFMLEYFSFAEIFDPSKIQALMAKAVLYIPESFPWVIFIVGLMIVIGGVVLFYSRNKETN